MELRAGPERAGLPSPVAFGAMGGCSWRSRSLRGPRGPVHDHLHRKWGLEGQSSHTGRATTVRQCPLRLAQKPRRHGGSRGGHGVINRRPDHVRSQVHGLRPPPSNAAASSLRRKGARRPAPEKLPHGDLTGKDRERTAVGEPRAGSLSSRALRRMARASWGSFTSVGPPPRGGSYG